MPPPIPPGLPASLLERRPDVVEAEQLLVAANADIGAAKALFYPNDQPDRLSRRRQRRSDDVPRRERAVWSVGAGLLQPVFQAGRLRRNLEAAQARYEAAVAEYQKAALNGYREVANALVTIQKLAEMRVQRQVGVTALQDASELSRAALRLRPRQLHRDSDGRRAALRSSNCCWRRRAVPSCARAPSCIARSAAVGSCKARVKAMDKAMEKMKAARISRRSCGGCRGSCATLQEWVKAKGLRVIVVFEGRDAAGKGGTIKAITERVSPRVFRLVALPAPSDREKSQMYVQRYLQHFPAAGEIVIFDRSWYNRAGVEHVMGFCTDEQYERFLKLMPMFERAHRRRRRHPHQVLARGRQQGAGAAVQRAHRRSAAAVEAEQHGPAVAREVVRVLARARRHAQGDRYASSRRGTSSDPTTRSARASTASRTC